MDFYQQKIYERLARFVPAKAVLPCYNLWLEAPFRFVVSKGRLTKLGDFSVKSSEDLAVITVNNNLNKYAFLLTYVHEVAHHRVYGQYGKTVKPHGAEWIRMFQKLMEPFLSGNIFPDPLRTILLKHMRQPKASSQSDLRLAQAIAAYDTEKPEGVALQELDLGSNFRLADKQFQSIEKRRTRIKCKEFKTGKLYLVHKLARVLPIN